MAESSPKVKKKQVEAARRNTRMRFEQWAKNPSCEANTVSAVRNVRMSEVARAEGLEPSFGQSPFAIARGETFEKFLFRDDASRMFEALARVGLVGNGARRFLDLRLKMNGGPRLSSLDDAIDETRSLLRRVASASTEREIAELPDLVAAPVLRIPQGVMLPEAVLIIDVLVVRRGPEGSEVIVGEVKTYPDRGGSTSPGELATARAQAGLYVHALDVVLEELELEDQIDVSRNGFLVLTYPGSNQPSVRAGEDLRYQAARAARGFALLEQAAAALPATAWAPDPSAPPEDLIAAVRSASTAYSEACLSFCDRAPGCHRAALSAGNPIVLGEDALRFLSGVDLHRLEELLDGAAPVSDVERDVVARIEQSELSARLDIGSA